MNFIKILAFAFSLTFFGQARADECSSIVDGARLGPHPYVIPWVYGRACVKEWFGPNPLEMQIVCRTFKHFENFTVEYGKHPYHSICVFGLGKKEEGGIVIIENNDTPSRPRNTTKPNPSEISRDQRATNEQEEVNSSREEDISKNLSQLEAEYKFRFDDPYPRSNADTASKGTTSPMYPTPTQRADQLNSQINPCPFARIDLKYGQRAVAEEAITSLAVAPQDYTSSSIPSMVSPDASVTCMQSANWIQLKS